MNIAQKFCKIAKNRVDNLVYSGFTTQKIVITGHNQEKVEIPVRFVETSDYDNRNLIDVSDLQLPKIYNYTDVPNIDGKKSEKIFNHFQLKFYALITPAPNSTSIKNICDYWHVSYRQGRYIRNLITQASNRDKFDVDYFFKLYFYGQ